MIPAVGLLERLESSILADLEASRLAGWQAGDLKACNLEDWSLEGWLASWGLDDWMMQWMVDGGWMMEDGCE